VNFVVTSYVEGTMDCDVTETGSPAGYAVTYDNCSWDNVLSADTHNCVINNTADVAEYSVTTNWIVPGAGAEEPNYDVNVAIICESEILSVSKPPVSQSTNEVVVTLGDGDSVVVTVDTELESSNCSATQNVTQSGVESTSNEACTDENLDAGESASCVFTNTLFFEGIPTLSQYGLAILVLLTLGVGMVGFRRFA